MFSRFEVLLTAPRAVGVALHPLADALAVFAALPPAELDITLPGTTGGLDLEAGDAAATGGGGRTHARVDTAEPPRAAPPPPAASGGEAYLLAPHALLREAVDDLEWAAGVAGGTARLALDRDPPGARLLAAGAGGTVEVALPTDRLDAFEMPFPTARHAYRHRHLRAAFGAPPPHAARLATSPHPRSRPSSRSTARACSASRTWSRSRPAPRRAGRRRSSSLPCCPRWMWGGMVRAAMKAGVAVAMSEGFAFFRCCCEYI